MIYVFGDSHAQVWKGTSAFNPAIQPKMEGVEVHHLGAALAWNLLDEAGTGLGKWGQAIFDILDGPDTAPATGIILTFGEIDIRTRAVRNAVEQGIGLADAVRPIADRLCTFAAMLARHSGVPVIIFEPAPSSSDFNNRHIPAFPITGTETERNVATEAFGMIAQEAVATFRETEGLAVYALGAFHDLSDHYETRLNAYRDSIHLGVVGFSIVLDRLEKLCRKHGLDEIWAPFADIRPCTPLARPADITGMVRQSLSSIRDGRRFLRAPKGHQIGLWTETEEAAHIDLIIRNAMPLLQLNLWAGNGEGASPLAGLVLDGGISEARSQISISIGPEMVRNAKEGPVTVDLSGTAPVKFLRLCRDGPGDICLARLQLVGMSFDRRFGAV